MTAADPIPSPKIHMDLEHPHKEFFAPWRKARAERYGSADAPRRPLLTLRRRKRRAAVTMVHNESEFLPIWLRYYSRFFGSRDLYVLDNDSTDDSTAGRGFRRVPVAHDRVDAIWMAETLAEFQHELLERYDVVLVSDVDEILAPDPAWGDLGQYMDRIAEEFVNPLGYEVVHLPDREDELDPRRPILNQRRHWFANDAYDKPLLATVPLAWMPGLHRSADGRHNYDPDLRLIHLHRMDYSLCRKRHRVRARRARADHDLAAGRGAHNRMTDGAEFNRWFFSESGFEEVGIEMRLEPIPPRWRNIV
jgi:hypothetical protein